MNGTEDLITRAEAIARTAHTGQVDKAGQDYIDHPRRVAANAAAIAEEQGLDSADAESAIAAAWLHDVVEDTSVSADDLRREFPTEVVAAVDAVTKRSGEAVEDYFARVRSDRLAVIVKTADLADNTDPVRQAALDDATRVRLAEKYRRAYELLGVDLLEADAD
ncbi:MULTISPECIES: HD domain-containing protein [unclassified Brevibacterium]|uniref:HD domain-containing protein n=1 Tax=unclassified Brevibacterium TaxID=2614124 RepID=UPI0010F59636|nr:MULTISPECIES: HD domain-containing protein [unclassified Brevibacterium]MCM1013658.1 HD domain-containing protein [Brevibacterium sp. XM4083]